MVLILGQVGRSQDLAFAENAADQPGLHATSDVLGTLEHRYDWIDGFILSLLFRNFCLNIYLLNIYFMKQNHKLLHFMCFFVPGQFTI